MKKNIKKRKARGFALIEVMVAALVLTVGGVAYMKLQRTGLQYGFNNAARSQGVALVTGFIEQLRSNVGYLRTVGLAADGGTGTALNASFLGGKVTAPTAEVNCNSSTASKACAEAIFGLHQYLTSEQMTAIAPAGNSRLCYTESATTAGMMRVTFIWRDNSVAGSTVDLSVCPNFNENLQQNNSVTVYAQL